MGDEGLSAVGASAFCSQVKHQSGYLVVHPHSNAAAVNACSLRSDPSDSDFGDVLHSLNPDRRVATVTTDSPSCDETISRYLRCSYGSKNHRTNSTILGNRHNLVVRSCNSSGSD